MINLRLPSARSQPITRPQGVMLGGGLGLGLLVISALGWSMNQTEQRLTSEKMALVTAVNQARVARSTHTAGVVAVDLATPNGLAQGLVALMQADLSDVCFTSLHVTSEGFVLHGQAASDAALTQFLKAWRVSALFSEIHMNSLAWDDSVNHVTFEFTAVKPSLDEAHPE